MVPSWRTILTPLGQANPGRNENWTVSPHLALLSFRPKDFCGGRALSEEQTQSVFLEAHVPDGPGRLPSLLPGVDEHQHLSRNQLRNTAPTATCFHSLELQQQEIEEAQV